MSRRHWWVMLGVAFAILWTAAMFALGEFVGLRECRGSERIEVISIPKGK